MIFFTDPNMLQNKVSLRAVDKSLIKTNGNQYKKGKKYHRKAPQKDGGRPDEGYKLCFCPREVSYRGVHFEDGKNKDLLLFIVTLTLTIEKRHNNVTLYSS